MPWASSRIALTWFHTAVSASVGWASVHGLKFTVRGKSKCKLTLTLYPHSRGLFPVQHWMFWTIITWGRFELHKKPSLAVLQKSPAFGEYSDAFAVENMAISWATFVVCWTVSKYCSRSNINEFELKMVLKIRVIYCILLSKQDYSYDNSLHNGIGNQSYRNSVV